FALVAVLTLALGIGATTAIFSVVEAFLLRPLPYPDPGRLVNVQCEMPGVGRMNVGTSVPEFEDLRDRAGVFEELSMVFPMHGNLTGVDRPQRVEALAVSPTYFRLLGASAAIGRTFGQEEEKVPGWAEGCVLSYGAWQSYFGGDPAALERKFWMDYDTYRVIGVMPPGFRHPGRTLTSAVDVWFTGGMRTPPFSQVPQRDRRVIPGMIGRLKPEMTLAEAQARMDGFAAEERRQFPEAYPVDGRWIPRMEPLQRDLVGDVRPVLWLLFGAVVLVLLICCATLANLLLVRAAGRRPELAIRYSLGASRGTVVRQLLVESLLLALCGGIAGMVLAWWLPQVVVAMAPVNLPRVNQVTVNANVLAFALVVSCLTGVLFGLIPALKASRFNLVTSLKEGGRGTGSGAASRHLRACFAGSQVALSLILLAGGGLLLKSFWNALQVDPGFDSGRVVAAGIWLPPPTDQKARQTYRSHPNRTIFVREVLRRMHTLPGVKDAAVGTGSSLPLAGEWNASPFIAEGRTDATGAAPTAMISSVTPDYFRTLGIPVRTGRPFTDADNGDNRVALVNEAAALRYWAGQDPLGRRVALSGTRETPQWWTIVGVVGNVKTEGVDAPDVPHIYLPLYQRSGLRLTVFLRTAGGAASWEEPIRGEIQAIDSDLPVFAVRSLEEMVERSLSQRRFAVFVVGAFAVVALVLAGLGIYGVVALTVSYRAQEMGLRMALGAQHSHIIGLVLRQGLALTACGIGVGLAGAAGLTFAIRGMLFNTNPLDPLTFACIVAMLSVVALIACWIPARRAAKVDPMVALRCE
ncbi:MAG: ABC transporter permease, partial [Chloroflexi bacterium]